jgi:predicted nucleic acid-binding protein
MKVLISDTSVLLNLLAADCLAPLTAATGWQIAVCPLVVQETKKLRDLATGELLTVDLAPLIASGLLHSVDIEHAEERVLYVDNAAVVDDGEAMAIAIAAHRNLDLATDDRQATNHSLRSHPGLRIWSTPQLLKAWSESTSLPAGTIAAAIRNIEERARYFPAKAHPLSEWWRNAKDPR